VDDPLPVLVPDPDADPVLDAVEAVPLAPVVAAAEASIESTRVTPMKEISDCARTVDVILVVMAVFDVASDAVSTLISVSRKSSGPT